MMVGCTAQGPEIAVEDAIQLRYVFQPNGLDLSRLPVTDNHLTAIPADVNRLALVDTSVTDQGVPTLVKLQRLSRINVAGTRITDDGLQELGKLPTLEWVCVNRTQVTQAGINRLKEARPDVAVIAGTEP